MFGGALSGALVVAVLEVVVAVVFELVVAVLVVVVFEVVELVGALRVLVVLGDAISVLGSCTNALLSLM